MTDEEMNQKMEFIVEHQAKFAAAIEILREAQTRLTSSVVGVIDVIGNLARSTDERINLLRETQMRNEQSIERLTEAQSQLTEAQRRTDERLAQTDERLNIFINVVERYISGNGGAESPA